MWPDCYELIANGPACEHHGVRQENHKKKPRGKRNTQPQKKTNHRNIPKSLRHQVMQRDERRCRTCGTSEDLTLDHRIPVSQGGKATMKNLWVLCRTCHNEKEGMGTHTPPKDKNV